MDDNEWTGCYQVKLYCECMTTRENHPRVERHWHHDECVPITAKQAVVLKRQHTSCKRKAGDMQIIRQPLADDGVKTSIGGYDSIGLSLANSFAEQAATEEAQSRPDIKHVARDVEAHDDLRVVTYTLVDHDNRSMVKFYAEFSGD